MMELVTLRVAMSPSTKAHNMFIRVGLDCLNIVLVYIIDHCVPGLVEEWVTIDRR